MTAREDASAELDDGPILERATELARILVSQDEEDLLREGTPLLHENEYLPIG